MIEVDMVGMVGMGVGDGTRYTIGCAVQACGRRDVYDKCDSVGICT